MLYVQLKKKIEKQPFEKIYAGDVALIAGEEKEKAEKILIYDGLPEGIWKISACYVAQKLIQTDENIHFTGENEVRLKVGRRMKRNGLYVLRSVLAFLLLFFGSALAITWFHEDVGMAEAQNGFYEKLTGRAPETIWEMAFPYAFGVGMGVAFYYGLLSLKKTPSPLEMKLAEYEDKAEENAGKHP